MLVDLIFRIFARRFVRPTYRGRPVAMKAIVQSEEKPEDEQVRSANPGAKPGDSAARTRIRKRDDSMLAVDPRLDRMYQAMLSPLLGVYLACMVAKYHLLGPVFGSAAQQVYYTLSGWTLSMGSSTVFV